jgi:hypothetical protein
MSSPVLREGTFPGPSPSLPSPAPIIPAEPGLATPNGSGTITAKILIYEAIPTLTAVQADSELATELAFISQGCL